MIASVGFALSAAILLLLYLLNPLLLRMALRNLVRRPLQMTFSIVGLAVSAVMIVGAFAIGDTLSHSLEAKVNGQLGNIAAVITRNITNPNDSQYFNVNQTARVLARFDQTAGTNVVPALTETVTARTNGRVVAGINLIGLPPSYEDQVGLLSGHAGQVRLNALSVGEVYITRKLAEEKVQPGDALNLVIAGKERNLKVKAVVELPGWIQDGAGIVVPMNQVQEWLGKSNQANVMLVTSPRASVRTLAPGVASDVAATIRNTLVDSDTSNKVRQFFAGSSRVDTVVGAYANLRPTSLLYPRAGVMVTALRDPAHSQDLITYLDEPDVRAWLSGVAFNATDQTELSDLLTHLFPYHVADTRQDSVVAARLEGQNTTTMFVAFGFFAVFAGFMLIFLIVSLLMEDRKREMGVFRAIGAKRRHVALLLFWEATAYGVVGTALGVVVGTAVARIMVQFLGNGYAHRAAISFYLSSTSLVEAVGLSLLLNTAVIAFAVAKSSRMHIVSAIRGLSEPDNPGESATLSSALAAGRYLQAVILLLERISRFCTTGVTSGLVPLPLGLGLAVAGQHLQHATILVLGYTFAGMGGLLLVRSVTLSFVAAHRNVLDWTLFTLGGLGLLGLWAVPSTTIKALGAGSFTAGMEIFLVAGVLEVVGAYWIFRYNMGWLSSVVTLPLRFVSKLAATGRLVVSSLSTNAVQMSMSVAMISLITFVLTTMFVVTSAMGGLRDRPELFTRGFDVRLDVPSASPIPDFAQRVASTPSLQNAIKSFGGRIDVPILIRQRGLGDGSWASYQALSGEHDYFQSSSQNGGHMILRAAGYDSDTAVWDALQNRADVAVITGDAVVVRQRFDLNAQSGPFVLQGFYLEDGRLPDISVEVKVPGDQTVKRLQVIGVVHSVGSEVGVITNTNTLAGLVPYALVPTKYFVKVQMGHTNSEVADALNNQMQQFGATATVLTQELATTLDEVDATNGVLAGFTGLGLFVGVAALGILSARAVTQRRQQIGMVRALGFRRYMVVLAFLLESVVVCLFGLVLGAGLGLALSTDLIRTVNKLAPVMRLAPPWPMLTAFIAGAFAFTLLVSGLAARQAAAVVPAEALRYE